MYRIKIDRNLCIGCLTCSTACMVSHGTNEARNQVLIDGESKFTPLFCRHCNDPDCVKACISGAICKNEDTGFIEYDKEKCAACYLCVMMCRYGHPAPDREKQFVVRCTFCQDTEEMSPACVEVCPVEAISLMEVK